MQKVTMQCVAQLTKTCRPVGLSAGKFVAQMTGDQYDMLQLQLKNCRFSYMTSSYKSCIYTHREP